MIDGWFESGKGNGKRYEREEKEGEGKWCEEGEQAEKGAPGMEVVFIHCISNTVLDRPFPTSIIVSSIGPSGTYSSEIKRGLCASMHIAALFTAAIRGYSRAISFNLQV